MPELPSIQIAALLHAGLLVSDLARAKTFYESVLGLTRYPNRPDLPYPGEWYELAGGQQLHLMQLANPDAASIRPEHGGRDRHIALAVKSMDALKSRLDSAGVKYTASKSGRVALFCRDPDANTLEFVELG
ncbi:VOC family protein [Thiobacillus sp.]|uniref:VOC family protein n=1 Tax=Thiobacillus sp. TaxID=924 RepID=UPI00286E0EB7|nr:VOC family protein [Thiobacillus sp.]